VNDLIWIRQRSREVRHCERIWIPMALKDDHWRSTANWHEEKELSKELRVRVMLGRALFLSDSRRWGMAPMSARKVNRVVLWQGVNIPYLVREADDGAYILVGKCYIYGGRIEVERIGLAGSGWRCPWCESSMACSIRPVMTFCLWLYKRFFKH